MASKTTAGNVTGADVAANNSTGRRNNRVVDGATDTDVNVLSARDGSAAEPADTKPNTSEATVTTGKLVRKEITAPSRLEKIRKGLDDGNPVKNVIVSRRAGKIRAWEMVAPKE